MTTLHLPSAAHVQEVISDCLKTLPTGAISEVRRGEIVSNCLGPMVLLLEAVHLAGEAGPDEEAVLIQCIRRLYAQAEDARRTGHFANLMQRLTEYRDTH